MENKQRAYEEFTALCLLPNRFFENRQSEHFERLARTLAAMNLFAAPDVLEISKRAYNLELKRDEHPEESEEYKRLNAELDSVRAKFIDAARKEFGLPVA